MINDSSFPSSAWKKYVLILSNLITAWNLVICMGIYFHYGKKMKTQVEQICFNFILIRVGESELPLNCKKEENQNFENHITFYCRLLHTLVVKMARPTTKNRMTVLIAGAQALLCRGWMEREIIMMAPATNQD